jgi:hypothetical protein
VLAGAAAGSGAGDTAGGSEVSGTLDCSGWGWGCVPDDAGSLAPVLWLGPGPGRLTGRLDLGTPRGADTVTTTVFVASVLAAPSAAPTTAAGSRGTAPPEHMDVATPLTAPAAAPKITLPAPGPLCSSEVSSCWVEPEACPSAGAASEGPVAAGAADMNLACIVAGLHVCTTRFAVKIPHMLAWARTPGTHQPEAVVIAQPSARVVWPASRAGIGEHGRARAKHPQTFRPWLQGGSTALLSTVLLPSSVTCNTNPHTSSHIACSQATLGLP